MPGAAAREAVALKYGRDLRQVVMHSTVYVRVCSSILALNLLLAPDQLVAPFVWLLRGIGPTVHAAGTCLFEGLWERRQVEPKLGRRFKCDGSRLHTASARQVSKPTCRRGGLRQARVVSRTVQ